MISHLTIRRRAVGEPPMDHAAGRLYGSWQVTSNDAGWLQQTENERLAVFIEGTVSIRRASSRGPVGAAGLLEFIESEARWAEDLDGEFVVVVIDLVRDEVCVVRDPLGSRPWYYSDTRAGIVASTHLPNVAQAPGVDTTIDEERLAERLAGYVVSTGPTLYRGIRTLPAGCAGHWHAADNGVVRRVHRFDTSPRLEVSWDSAVSETRERLFSVIRADLDGPATSELSGGLDSSGIVSVLAREQPGGLLVGRMLFDNREADERVYSDEVIRAFGIDHVSAVAWHPDEGELDALGRHLGLPVPPTNSYMAIDLLRTLSQRGRVTILTGIGGDHAFASASVGARVLAALGNRDIEALKRYTAWMLRNPLRTPRKVLAPAIGLAVGRRPRRQAPTWIRDEVRKRYGIDDKLNPPTRSFTGVHAVDSRWRPVLDGSLTGILESNAAIGTFVGVRHRNPYLASTLIQSVYGLAPEFARRGNVERALQREIFRGCMPEPVRRRTTKAEFSAPTWARFAEIQGRLGPERTLCADLGWIDQRGLTDLYKQASEGRVWAAVMATQLDSIDRWLHR